MRTFDSSDSAKMAKSSFSQELGHCIMDEKDDEFETNFYGLSDEDENDNYHKIECVENRDSQAGSKVNVEAFESEEEIEIGIPDDWDSQKCDDEDILANQFELNERDFDSDSDSSVYEADIIKEFCEDQQDRDHLLDYKPSFSTKPTSRHFRWDDEEENGTWNEDVGMVLDTDKTKWDNIGIRRTVVFDVANVMYKNSRDSKPDAFGILPIVYFWQLLEFSLVLVVPAGYMSEGATNNSFILDVLQDYGLLVVVPNKFHDDRVVLEIARVTGGVVMSNDLYRDHLFVYNDDGKRSFVKTIKERLMKFSLSYNSSWIDGKKDEGVYCGYKLKVQDCKESMTALYDSEDLELVLHTRKAKFHQPVQKRLQEELQLMADYFRRKLTIEKQLEPPPLPYLNGSEMPDYYEFRKLALSYSLGPMKFVSKEKQLL